MIKYMETIINFSQGKLNKADHQLKISVNFSPVLEVYVMSQITQKVLKI